VDDAHSAITAARRLSMTDDGRDLATRRTQGVLLKWPI